MEERCKCGCLEIKREPSRSSDFYQFFKFDKIEHPGRESRTRAIISRCYRCWRVYREPSNIPPSARKVTGPACRTGRWMLSVFCERGVCINKMWMGLSFFIFYLVQNTVTWGEVHSQNGSLLPTFSEGAEQETLISHGSIKLSRLKQYEEAMC